MPRTLLCGQRAEILIVADSDFGQARARSAGGRAAAPGEAPDRLRLGRLAARQGGGHRPAGAEPRGEGRHVRQRRVAPAALRARPSRRRARCGRWSTCWPTCWRASIRRGRSCPTGQVFDRLAGEHPAFAGLSWDDLPAVGVTLNVPQAQAAADSTAASVAQEI